MTGFYCRVCGMQFPATQRSSVFMDHVKRCVQRNADIVDELRPKRPFEGDPELLAFAMAEGSVHNRQPGTRKQPR